MYKDLKKKILELWKALIDIELSVEQKEMLI